MRCGAVAVAVGLAALTLPAPAGAQATFSAACAPTTISYPGSTEITCALAVTTGAQEERFTVSPRSPQFGGAGPDAEFGTLANDGRVTLTGPGELGLGAFTIVKLASCGGTRDGWHGEFSGGGVQDVTIPANSQSSLTSIFYPSEPPWPGDSIAPFFEVGNTMVSGDESTIAGPLAVRTLEPTRTGTSGLRILIKTNPESARQPAKPTRTKLGTKIVIKGRSEPVLRRKVMELQIVGPITARTRVRPVRTDVRTGRKGKFQTSFKPESAGRYEIAMAFDSKSPAVADGYTCGRLFNVIK